jgi:hypothetical protein
MQRPSQQHPFRKLLRTGCGIFQIFRDFIVGAPVGAPEPIHDTAMGDGKQEGREQRGRFIAVLTANHGHPHFLEHFFGICLSRKKADDVAIKRIAVAVVESLEGRTPAGCKLCHQGRIRGGRVPGIPRPHRQRSAQHQIHRLPVGLPDY